jgi:stage II sporulation protein AA (anti-sigma F factor antagonist)
MNTSALTIGQSRDAGVCVVTLSGRIDSTNANDLMRELTSLISSGEKSIVVDFGSVMYLTSAAFRALLVATDAAERNAAAFVLCSLGGHVRDLFEMGGLLDVFAIQPSRVEAVAKLA